MTKNKESEDDNRRKKPEDDERGRGGVFEKGDKNLLLFDLFCV